MGGVWTCTSRCGVSVLGASVVGEVGVVVGRGLLCHPGVQSDALDAGCVLLRVSLLPLELR